MRIEEMVVMRVYVWQLGLFGVLVGSLMFVAGCEGADSGLPDPLPVPTVDIDETVFGFSDETGGLYLVPFAGGDPEAIISQFSDAEAMVWSPDGEQVAFHSRSAGDTDIYVASISDGTVLRLTGEPDREAWPSWSPDGTQLIFERIYGDSRRDLFVVGAHGGDEIRLTDREGHDEAAAFSANGQQVVFVSDRDSAPGSCDDGQDPSSCNLEIYVMGSGGSDPKRLTRHEAIDGFPRWSPDGTQIVFHSNRDGGDWEIYVMNPDGSDQTNLSDSPGSDGHACWSPDGSRIAFESMRGGRIQLYHMAPDGSDVMPISGTNDGHYVSWSSANNTTN
jgi:Tol biopolymer transport system component